MSKKYTQEFVENFLLERKIKLLCIYQGNLQKLDVKCLICGFHNFEKWHPTFNRIQQEHGCPKCAKQLKPVFEDVYMMFLEKNIKLISTNYVHNKYKLDVECLCCKYKWKSTVNKLQHGYGCPKCGGTKPKTIEDCCTLAKNRGGECLSTEYKNNRTKLLWACGLGHMWETTYKSVYMGHWCAECVGTNKKTIEDCIKLAESRGGKCLSLEYKNVKKDLLWECSKKHQWYAAFGNVNNAGSWCHECCLGKSQKQLYAIIKNLFPECDVVYNFRGFNWLTTEKRKQEIDIFIKQLNLAIEYDGEQHFRSIEYWGGEKKLKKIQALDNLKNKLILEHSEEVKHFIRIPYWEKLTEENVKRILMKNKVI